MKRTREEASGEEEDPTDKSGLDESPQISEAQIMRDVRRLVNKKTKTLKDDAKNLSKTVSSLKEFNFKLIAETEALKDELQRAREENGDLKRALEDVSKALIESETYSAHFYDVFSHAAAVAKSNASLRRETIPKIEKALGCDQIKSKCESTRDDFSRMLKHELETTQKSSLKLINGEMDPFYRSKRVRTYAEHRAFSEGLLKRPLYIPPAPSPSQTISPDLMGPTKTPEITGLPPNL